MSLCSEFFPSAAHSIRYALRDGALSRAHSIPLRIEAEARFRPTLSSHNGQREDRDFSLGCLLEA